MIQISELMRTDPVSLDPEARLEQAWRIMHDNRIRHVPICKDGNLVGLVTQKDLLVNSQNPDLLSLPVAEIMVFNVHTASASTHLVQAARTMLEKRVSCLPVVDGEKLLGIVTESDLIELLVEMLEAAR